MHRGNVLLLLLTIGLIVSLTGCGQDTGPTLANVSGTVTMDGKPLPEATVTFYPADDGRPSHGITDENGNYTLQFTGTKEGAMVGQHSVKVEVGVQTGESDSVPASRVPQLPARYNTMTELKAEVERGSNSIDFDLTSQ